MIPAEIVRQVRRIQLITARQVASVLAGAYVSAFRGTGVEFDEVRPYVPGDDVRTIDWNVTARMGSPFVKRYVEERQLTVMLLVDMSASLDFGSAARSKREAAAELSALLAFSAIHNDDKVGLLLFHHEVDEYIPPREGQRHALRVIREVLARGREEAAGQKPRRRLAGRFRELFGGARRRRRRTTNISAALEFCQRVLRQRTILFLVSDFLDDGYLDVLSSTNRRHDVVAVRITDPRESTLERGGLITLEDAESGAQRLIDTGSAGFREAMGRAAEARAKTLERQLRGVGIDLLNIDAAGSVVEPLVQFFRMRKRRARR